MGDPARHVRQLHFSHVSKTFPPGTVEITNDMITDRFILEEVVIPDSVKRIAHEAFKWCSELKVVRFGTGLESIGNGAFQKCDKLKSIHVPGNLKTVGNEAFWNCSSLTAVHFPDTTTEIGLDVFEGCSSLLEFKVPLGVKKLPRKMFARCEKLQSIELHENTEEIGDRAFYLCAALKPFFMPDSVKRIGKNSFVNCKSLTELSLSKNLTEIGEGAFSHSGLCKMVVPQKVENVGINAFGSCFYLQELRIPPRVRNLDCVTGGCCSLRLLIVPAGITNLSGVTSCFKKKSFEDIPTFSNRTFESPGLTKEDRLTVVFYGADERNGRLGERIVKQSLASLPVVDHCLFYVDFEAQRNFITAVSKFQKVEGFDPERDTYFIWREDVQVRVRTPSDNITTGYEEDEFKGLSHATAGPAASEFGYGEAASEHAAGVEPPPGGGSAQQ